MTLKGIELEFKLTKASTAERYENALKAMRARADALREQPMESLAAGLRAQITLVREFVDAVFGEGVYDKLGLDPDELEEHLDVVQSIVDEAGVQTREIQARVNKYTPNRSARRAVQYPGSKSKRRG